MTETVLISRRRIWRRAGLLGAWLIVLACTAAPAQPVAGADTPTAVVQRTVDGVIATLADPSLNAASKKRQVKAIIGRHFDFRAMSNRVLALNWKKANKEQRAKFTRLFRELRRKARWKIIWNRRAPSLERTAHCLCQNGSVERLPLRQDKDVEVVPQATVEKPERDHRLDLLGNAHRRIPPCFKR